MTENRRRFRNKKREDGRQGPPTTTPVTIARREDLRTPLVLTKILLKKEGDSNPGSSSSGSYNELPTSIRTIIINRSDAAQQGCNPPSTNVTSTLSSSSTAAKEKTNGTPTFSQDSSLPTQMTRSAPLYVSSGVFNSNAHKFFHKTNTDFAVIGVLGAQGVGKSTLLNLLASERANDYDYYQHIFAPEADECIFSTRHGSSQQSQSHRQHQHQHQHQRQHQSPNSSKQVLNPRTESLQFFITRERFVLLDTAPMLAGTTSKDADHLDLQTLATTMHLLSVCHVLLLALDELSLEQLRLLHAALRLRPRAPYKGYVRDYLPQLIFVRTRAKRQDYEPARRDQLDKQLALLFESTGLPIHRGRGEARVLNSFLLPELSGNAAVAHHAAASEVVRQFRDRVFTTVRTSMCQSNDFSESLWYELFTETAKICATDGQHFEQIFAEIKLCHLELRPKWRPDSNWRSEST
ncbi:hypothetical protein AWZ03_010259 [Drosophila navojoa]|uniref:Protein SMG9 n=1 Tax=Drosophila navojoa TaxID=7232 RepID=A0A484B3T6_DRONA|nr:protein SMG9 [Drosophila navojoa]TDG43324.1 hypothetical protein AWZ03_010259 [Drosophila navojoa]